MRMTPEEIQNLHIVGEIVTPEGVHVKIASNAYENCSEEVIAARIENARRIAWGILHRAAEREREQESLQ